MKKKSWIIFGLLTASFQSWAAPTLKSFDAAYDIRPDYTYTVRTKIAQVATSGRTWTS